MTQWTVTSSLPHLRSQSKLPYLKCELKTLERRWEEHIHAVHGKLENGGLISDIKELRALRFPPHIRQVPGWLGDLTQLEELHICYCERVVEIPPAVGLLSGLRLLNLAGAKNVQHLPSSLGHLKNLEVLNLSYCKNLKSIPSSLARLPHLRDIILASCPLLKTPPPEVVREGITAVLDYIEKLDYLGGEGSAVDMLEHHRIGTAKHSDGHTSHHNPR